MFGLEFPPLMEVEKDVTFAMCLDLLIVRIVFIRWKEADGDENPR
jgi:hypothetical protein